MNWQKIQKFLFLWVIYFSGLTAVAFVFMFVISPLITYTQTGILSLIPTLAILKKTIIGVVFGSLMGTILMYFFGKVFEE